MLQRIRSSFVDADKQDYHNVDIALERRTPFFVPGCSFEYASINFQQWLQELYLEWGDFKRTPEEAFGELELLQLEAAFDGPGTRPEVLKAIRNYFDNDTDYQEYLDSLFFVYYGHENPFKRLEVLIVHLLTIGSIPCYSSQGPFLKPIFEDP